ncbi:MAG: hypothetical protein HY394_04355 [Candidatus Diapherotrites archaeon]|nr:hypothetical protein [Candidatus Diapherotrites archaeon]
MALRRAGGKRSVPLRFRDQREARRRLAERERLHAEGVLPKAGIGPMASRRIINATARDNLERQTSETLGEFHARMERQSGWPSPEKGKGGKR